MKPEEHSWRDINMFGTSLFRLDWADILGLCLVGLSIVLATFLLAMR